MLLSQFGENIPEAGTDEAGRGCLSGPVVAAAVIFPKDYQNKLLNDSKKLNASQRESLREVIMRDALCWAVAEVSHTVIDEINILNASFLAMHHALAKLSQKPLHIIVDGNRFKPFQDIPHQCIVKGDGKYLSIAAASILAKTHRDDLMTTLAAQYPGYGWERNMGYGTLEHRKAILEKGYTDVHRKSFSLKSQLELVFLKKF